MGREAQGDASRHQMEGSQKNGVTCVHGRHREGRGEGDNFLPMELSVLFVYFKQPPLPTSANGRTEYR